MLSMKYFPCADDQSILTLSMCELQAMLKCPRFKDDAAPRLRILTTLGFHPVKLAYVKRAYGESDELQGFRPNARLKTSPRPAAKLTQRGALGLKPKYFAYFTLPTFTGIAIISCLSTLLCVS
ncbi:hypothetical protein EVAR_51250_1 [Eumeta japonica]|uniref:Uncharacterized protein n=1 Tax=Eumeta variegata TaxID=151549 RepID=A0A4C1X2M2_EUMVA|nr:hypothetical protein EVAR_51250_1 [Eumeta japonica]